MRTNVDKRPQCDICGKEAVDFEPRFGYWTCEEHINVPPAYRYDFKESYEKADSRHRDNVRS
mgnify:CR=1 FL=1